MERAIAVEVKSNFLPSHFCLKKFKFEVHSSDVMNVVQVSYGM